MAIAAVPAYLGKDFASASPGLRFSFFLKSWDQHFKLLSNKHDAWKDATRLNPQDRQLMAALLARQNALAEPLQQTGQLLRVDANAIAPLTTGLGNEHPLENGFAFLNPYGLPYLPGSGVKGVLRQAARELASGDWGDTHGWELTKRFPLIVNNKPIQLSLLDVLFGKQSQDQDTDHVRGALQCWDVYPQLSGQKNLAVEVMTAHQSHYLQGRDSPHESGQPNPINFLTVPPGAGFHFHIQCDQPFLACTAPELAAAEAWQPLLNAALEHAFDWLGFGAKTAVGYGAMRRDRTAELARQQAEQAATEQRAREEAERQREREAAAKAQAEQDAFDALPESDKALRQFSDGLATLGEPPLNKDSYATFARLLNSLAEQAQSWPDATERQRAAEALTTALERFGWSGPGLKADKRKKQQAKRQQQLDTVVQGHA